MVGLQITGSLNGFVWILAWAENSAVAVERIKEYSEVEQESSWESTAPPPE